MARAIAVGEQDFVKIRENDYFYIDKTWMLKELSDQKGVVNLITRPRRFGKTLALSTVRTFFEDERTYTGEKIDNSRFFSEKKIMAAGEHYTSQTGSYPVAF